MILTVIAATVLALVTVLTLTSLFSSVKAMNEAQSAQKALNSRVNGLGTASCGAAKRVKV